MSKDTKQQTPKEAQVMAAILKEMGITDYEPGVVNQMLELTYRYTSQVLDDARAYSNYAKKSKTIEMDDVKLAIQMQMEHSFTTPPPRDLLLELSRARNSNPLPTIKLQYGIRLPPDRYCLSACNFHMKAPKKVAAIGGNRLGGAKMAAKPAVVSVLSAASKGNTGGPSSQAVTLVQKPIPSTPVGPQQKVVSVGRPMFKVTAGPPGGPIPKVGPPMDVVKFETTDSVGNKRKLDDDGEDYDVL